MMAGPSEYASTMNFERTKQALDAYFKALKAGPNLGSAADGKRALEWQQGIRELARQVHEAFWLDGEGRYTRRRCHFEMSIDEIREICDHQT